MGRQVHYQRVGLGAWEALVSAFRVLPTSLIIPCCGCAQTSFGPLITPRRQSVPTEPLNHAHPPFSLDSLSTPPQVVRPPQRLGKQGGSRSRGPCSALPTFRLDASLLRGRPVRRGMTDLVSSRCTSSPPSNPTSILTTTNVFQRQNARVRTAPLM